MKVVASKMELEMMGLSMGLLSHWENTADTLSINSE